MHSSLSLSIYLNSHVGQDRTCYITAPLLTATPRICHHLRLVLLFASPVDAPSLDLQLSINHQPIRRTSDFMQKRRPVCKNSDAKIDLSRIEALRWHSAEQIRLAAIERAYAEQIRELTRKEMELAQSEFARARLMWKKVQEEVENAERQKVRATYQIDSSCMEITCQACQQRFRP